jgi:hypothetical protein
MRYSSGLPVVDGVINNLTDEIERFLKYCSACAAACLCLFVDALATNQIKNTDYVSHLSNNVFAKLLKTET